jgi:cell division protein FtsB
LNRKKTKIKIKTKKPGRNIFKSRGFLLLVALVAFIVILTFFFGDSGIIEIIKARNKIEELKENIAQLEKEKEKLLKEIEELKQNPLALEKKAREDLWLMKKNEKVVVIIHDDKKKKEEKESSAVQGKKEQK